MKTTYRACIEIDVEIDDGIKDDGTDHVEKFATLVVDRANDIADYVRMTYHDLADGGRRYVVEGTVHLREQTEHRAELVDTIPF